MSTGRAEEAEPRLRMSANAGHGNAMYELAVLLQDSGRIEEAKAWYGKAANTGLAGALDRLRELGGPADGYVRPRKTGKGVEPS